MTIGYYPGCTLKTKAKNLEESALASLAALGVEITELPRWNCCGAVFSLADDDLIHHIASVRDLVRAKDAGHDELVTLCSMCYNTLARANLLMKGSTPEDAEKQKTINLFMDEETDYFGEVRVRHYLEFLATDVGWDRVRAAVKTPLTGLRVGGYYGCTLLRPSDVAIDDPNLPRLFGAFIRAIGAEPVDFAEATACCSSYQIIANEGAALAAAGQVIKGAKAQEIEALAMSCPVCEYNLGKRQDDARARVEGLGEVPTFYFTQLLAVALGLPEEDLGLSWNEPRSAELLREKHFVPGRGASL